MDEKGRKGWLKREGKDGWIGKTRIVE